MFNLAPIGIKDAITKISIRARGLFNNQNLIGTNTKLAMGELLPLLPSDITEILINAIEYNEIIAGTMHFGEA